VLVSTTLYPSAINPVAGIFVKEMAKCISINHNVIVLHCAEIPKNSGLKVGIYDESMEDLRVIHVFVKKRTVPNLISVTMGLLKGLNYLKKCNVRIDVIHAHFFSSVTPFLILMRSKPVVLSEHWSGYALKLLPKYAVPVIRIVIAHCKVICPVSKFLLNSIQSYGIKGKFFVIHNPVDTKYFFPSAKIPSNKIRVLVVGNQVPVKGIPVLLNAVYAVSKFRSDFQIDIVGDGPNLVEYIKLMKDLKLEKLISFHGSKSKEEVAEFVRSCDFLMISSLVETQSVVAAEALCCGKPVLATAVGGIPEFIDSSTGILVKPNNVIDLQNGILQMLDSFSHYDSKKIAQKGRELFSYDSINLQINEVYKKVLES